MKRRFIIIALFAALLFTFPSAVHAAESGSNLTITIVMPDAPAEPEPEAAPTPPRVYLFPSRVDEIRENGGRSVVRVYELEAYESPNDISRESFTRGGWEYELAEITKAETSISNSREQTEVVQISTDSNVTDVIMRQLAPTIEYNSGGFSGVLSLNIASIKVETAGTRTSSFTLTEKREYPHLSRNDTALVPKTITVGGKTYNLANVEWRAGNTVTIDYVAVPEYYTAVATYTATGSRTAVTGYITTAEYTGTVAKIEQGRTVYTATFTGTEIMPEVIPLEITEQIKDADEPAEIECTAEANVTETPEISPEVIEETTEAEEVPETETIDLTVEDEPEDEIETETEEAENPSDNTLILIAVSALTALIIGGITGHFVIPKLKIRKGKGEIIE